jgi:prepilin-type N-terminal cleavage/methylation domain-containing protein
MKKNVLRNERGFTLIEIIAVLVILGILAAVAIPKYFDLQGEARQKAVDGAIAALQSTATMEYSKGLLNGTYNATNGPNNVAANGVNVGDFTGQYNTTGGITTVTVDNGSTNGWNDGVTNLSKSFTMHE